MLESNVLRRRLNAGRDRVEKTKRQLLSSASHKFGGRIAVIALRSSGRLFQNFLVVIDRAETNYCVKLISLRSNLNNIRIHGTLPSTRVC